MNKATGQPHFVEAQQPDMPLQSLPPAERFPPLAQNAETAFGLGGMARGVANSAFDAAGLNPPYPGTMEAAANFEVLQEALINDIAGGYSRQPPKFLLENIQSLTPEPGRPMQGAEAAQTKLRALRQNMNVELQSVLSQAQRLKRPADQEKLLQRKAALETAIARLDSALGSFGGGSDIDSIAGKWAD